MRDLGKTRPASLAADDPISLTHTSPERGNPTLLIVGERDPVVIGLNWLARRETGTSASSSRSHPVGTIADARRHRQ